MERFAVLTNRRSTRARRELDAVRQLLAAEPATLHVEIDGPADLPDALDRLAAAGTTTLAVNAGDGTVQALLTQLRAGTAFATPPALVVLAGGNTSMIATDVGIAGSPRRVLARICAQARNGEIAWRPATRPLLRITLTPGSEPHYGMFFGAAGITQATLLTRRRVHALGFTGGLAPALTLAATATGLILGLPGATKRFAPTPMTISPEDGPPITGDFLVFLATTLERLFLGLRPFWNGEESLGHIAVTCVNAHPRRLALALPAALCGRAAAVLSAENGYRSFKTDRLRLALSCPFTLDGEILEPVAGEPVMLAYGGDMTFARI